MVRKFSNFNLSEEELGIIDDIFRDLEDEYDVKVKSELKESGFNYYLIRLNFLSRPKSDFGKSLSESIARAEEMTDVRFYRITIGSETQYSRGVTIGIFKEIEWRVNFLISKNHIGKSLWDTISIMLVSKDS